MLHPWCSTPARDSGACRAFSAGRAFRGSILLTHLHWDHLQGLPFFSAGDRDDAEVRLAMPDQGDPVDVLSRAMSPPHFPIGPDGLRGKWQIRRDVGRPTPHRGLRHPGLGDRPQGRAHLRLPGRRRDGHRWRTSPITPSWVESGRRSADERLWSNALELVTGVDVLIHDAQFVEKERAMAVAYGHATIEAAWALAERAGVTTVDPVPSRSRPHRPPTHVDGGGAFAGASPRQRSRRRRSATRCRFWISRTDRPRRDDRRRARTLQR